MGYYGDAKIAKWLGNINLFYGIGKMTGSFLAGSIQKLMGKLNVLYTAEIFNALSLGLQCVPNIWVFLVGRIFNGFYCGFNSTTAPRLIIETLPTAQRGYTTSGYSLSVCIGVCCSFSIGKVFGEDTIERSWQYFIWIPAAVAMSRLLFIWLFCNHDTPLQYLLVSKNTEDPTKKIINEQKCDHVLATFNKNFNSIAFEKKFIIEQIEKSEKSVEKSLWD
jgi:MFS family permease